MSKLSGEKELYNKNTLYVYIIDAGIGDCILIHQIKPNIKILIDSGPEKGRGRISVQKALKEILGKGNIIDLAIVTHNDNDHIGGFSNLIKNKIIEVKEFIFNDASYINKIIPDYRRKFSLRQDKVLQKTIQDININIKTFFNKTNLNIHEKFSFGDFKFEFLSPNEEKLVQYKKWLKSEETKISKEIKYSVPNHKSISTNEDFNRLIESLKIEDVCDEDKREPNGSSLAFTLKIGNKNFLFLGDSHPTLISKELKSITNKKFDFCKLSHHGSEKNTSKELLSEIDCQHFIICSDGTNKYGHPSLKTFARVLISNPNAKFYFSSDSNEIKNITRLSLLKSELAIDGFLRIIYEY